MDQLELAEFFARQISPESCTFDRWATSPAYLRDLYGQDVADTYVRIRDREIMLSEEGIFGKYILDQLGIQPPYEISVPARFSWVELPPD
jgi:hypothetical protein